MNFNYFVASRYRNKTDVLRLVHGIKNKGKTVYSFIESDVSERYVGAVNGNAEDHMKKYEAIKNWQHDERIRQIFESDMQALRNSDILILLLPAGKSAHMEAGAAYGMNKKCILIGTQKETESLYLLFQEQFDSIESFLCS